MTDTPDTSWLAKVLADPQFADVWNDTLSVDAVEAAGWFDDGLDEPGLRKDKGLPTLPMHRLDPGGGVVLVTTGGFAPLHDGHITMMENAAATVEASGRHVAGGYVCCDHDNYVNTKAHTRHWPSERRVTWAARRLGEHPWLAVDPWAALYAPGALNFTDICTHVADQLDQRRPGTHYEVWYVFGSDNAGFAAGFARHGHAVCVPRPGAGPVSPSGRTLVAEAGIEASSTSIRTQEPAPQAPRGDVYVVRDDLAWATAHLGVGHDVTGQLCDTIATTLQGAVNRPVLVVDLACTTAIVDSLAEQQAVVLLDVCVDGHLSLGLSRRFELDGVQAEPKGVGVRPGHLDVDDQIAGIVEQLDGKPCVLVDDDSSTGATIQTARDLLCQAGINVTEVVTLIDTVTTPHQPFDVVDARDFIVGARDAGLVVEHAGGTARVPYLAPYVALWSRARLWPGTSSKVSAALWELNASLHDHTGMLVGDLDDGFAALLAESGWDREATVAKMCRWHAKLLNETTQPGCQAAS
jgi:nicotinic acid mononucleotide adenylyltransferase